MIYFDNAATTRALPAVAEKMSTMLCEQYGNPASVSAMGLAAEKEIRNVAEIIARGIRCKYDEVFFTSGGRGERRLWTSHNPVPWGKAVSGTIFRKTSGKICLYRQRNPYPVFRKDGKGGKYGV